MAKLIRWIFSWWYSATLGTRFTIMKHGTLIATDERGNRYFVEKKARKGFVARRWVMYDGIAEASKVPAEWHGWLHHTTEVAPCDEPPVLKPWERDHQPNLTGTDLAYHPKGSLAAGGERASATGDYQAWSPDDAK